MGKIVEESRPGGLRFAHEAHVAQPLEKLLLDRHQRATDRREDLGLAEPHQDLPHPFLLHDHARDADDVVAGERRPVDLLNVLVDERHVMLSTESGERRQRARDHGAPLVARVERQREVKPPVRRFETGIDQADREFSTRPPRRKRGLHERGRGRGWRREIDHPEDALSRAGVVDNGQGGTHP